MDTTDKLFTDYNNIPEQENLQRLKLKDYTPEVVNKKLNDFRQLKVEEIKKRVKYELIKIESTVLQLGTKIPAIKFPLRYSPLSNDKLLSEMQKQNAYSFLGNVKDFKAKQNEIEEAFNSNNIDYANSLLDLVLLTKPDELSLSNASKEEKEFYLFVNEIKKDFDNKHKLVEIQAELLATTQQKKELNYLLESMDKGIPFVVTTRQIRQMQNSEVSKIPVDYLNNAMAYFS